MSDRDAVVEKFAKVIKTPQETRRVDYKGHRRRVNMRLNPDLARQLQLIKLASGEDKNSFCERILTKAVLQRVEELRRGHSPEIWQAFETMASRRR